MTAITVPAASGRAVNNSKPEKAQIEGEKISAIILQKYSKKVLQLQREENIIPNCCGSDRSQI